MWGLCKYADKRVNRIAKTYNVSSFYIQQFKHLLDNFVSFLTKSSLYIAVVGALEAYFPFLLYQISVEYSLVLANSLLTFTVYNLNKLTDIKEDSINLPERAGFVNRNKKIITYATIASYVAALSLAYLQNPFAILIILFPLSMGAVYSIKILSFRLKDILGVKNAIVALAWAGTCSFLPLTVSFRVPIQILLVFYFLFIRCVINTTTFDVRDMEGDRITGVRTIPVVFGRQKAKNLLLALNTTLIPWLAFSYLAGYFHQYLFVLIFAIAYGYWYILHFCKEGLKIGKSMDLLVDGEWILIVLLCLITQYFVGFA